MQGFLSLQAREVGRLASAGREAAHRAPAAATPPRLAWRKSSTGLLAQPTEMYVIRARFFTRPQACPSGVSAGQIMPHWLLCSWRGLAILPSRPMGELMRRRWLRVEA